MSNAPRDPSRSSVAVGRDEKRSWLPWLLLLLLALLIVGAIVLATSGGDDDDAENRGSASSAVTTPADATAATSGSTSASTPTGTGGETATLTADGASIDAGDAAAIKDHVGQDATGAGLTVLSVVGSGFFVGTGPGDQQFIEFGSKVGEGEPEPYAPKVGDVVSLTGPVRPAPKDPADTLELTPPAAQAVTERGAYVNAETVSQAR